MFKTALASAACGGVAFVVTRQWHSPLGLLPAVAAALATYGAVTAMIKPLHREDVQALLQVVSRSGRMFRSVAQ
jgi:hypothetical protein